MTDDELAEKLESHEFIGWYEGFHQRDAEIEHLTAERDRLKDVLEYILTYSNDPPVIDRVRRALAEPLHQHP